MNPGQGPQVNPDDLGLGAVPGGPPTSSSAPKKASKPKPQAKSEVNTLISQVISSQTVTFDQISKIAQLTGKDENEIARYLAQKGVKIPGSGGPDYGSDSQTQPRTNYINY